MKKSKTLLIIFLISLIVSCADAEETPVEVYYGDVTNEQMFINIKNNDLNEVKRFVEINRKYLNIKDENGYTPLMLSALYLSLIHISEPTRP